MVGDGLSSRSSEGSATQTKGLSWEAAGCRLASWVMPVASSSMSFRRCFALMLALIAGCAVQIPVEGWASDFASAKYDRADPR